MFAALFCSTNRMAVGGLYPVRLIDCRWLEMRQNDGPVPSPDTAATSRSQTTPHHGPLPRNRSGTDTAQAPCGNF